MISSECDSEYLASGAAPDLKSLKRSKFVQLTFFKKPAGSYQNRSMASSSSPFLDINSDPAPIIVPLELTSKDIIGASANLKELAAM